ncbi:hypothetical protein I3843_02G045100 [Carya illinoinensis]|nr:hypothetical protein I3843_02G045100 [Carya illinoinensis]
MSLFTIPASVAARIEKLYRDFLWSGLGDEFKFHLINWDTVCRPISLGGLGIKNLRIFNRALLGKWFWRYNMEPEALWKVVVHSKYGNLWGGWCTREGNGSYGVGMWKQIRRGWRMFANNTKLLVGEGTRISFWRDIWCGEEALKDTFPCVYLVACDQEASVADLLVRSGDQVHWNITFCRAAHDWEVNSFTDLFNRVYSMKPNGLHEDKLWWKHTGKGIFSVCSYYKALTATPNVSFPWKRLWRNKAPHKTLFFVWTAALGKILTTDNLRKRRVIITDWCCMRKKDGESVNHLLLHCETARALWCEVFRQVGLNWVMPKSVLELLASWACREEIYMSKLCGRWYLSASCGAFGKSEMNEHLKIRRGHLRSFVSICSALYFYGL